jgi:hypothetical protein
MDYRGDIDGHPRQAGERKAYIYIVVATDEPTLGDVCSYDNGEIYLPLSVTEIEGFRGCSCSRTCGELQPRHVVRKLLVDCQAKASAQVERERETERERERERERAWIWRYFVLVGK